MSGSRCVCLGCLGRAAGGRGASVLMSTSALPHCVCDPWDLWGKMEHQADEKEGNDEDALSSDDEEDAGGTGGPVGGFFQKPPYSADYVRKVRLCARPYGTPAPVTRHPHGLPAALPLGRSLSQVLLDAPPPGPIPPSPIPPPGPLPPPGRHHRVSGAALRAAEQVRAAHGGQSALAGMMLQSPCIAPI